MKKLFSMVASCMLVMLAVSAPIHAQSGCDDSPENPTLVLSGLAASAYVISRVRASKKRH